MAASGACYGFRIRSALPLRYLREEGRGEALEVLEGEVPSPELPPIQTWDHVPDRRPGTRLYRDERGFTIEVGGDGQRFRVEPRTGRVVASPTSDPLRRETLMWMTPAGVAVAARGDLAIHAASVEVEGAGALVTGPGGSGKSSTAAAFWAAGHRVLADDSSCCRSGEEPAVWPGPALIRLRPDAAERLRLDDTSVTVRMPDRVHLALEGPRRRSGDAVPLHGIFFLTGGHGEPRVEQVAPDQALRDLWAMSYFLPADEDRARCFRGLGELVGRVPCWRLSRRLRWQELPAVVERIAGRLGEG